MPIPIAHSTLINWMHSAKVDGKPLPPRLIEDLIILTRVGVNPEGVELPMMATDSEAATHQVSVAPRSRFVLGVASRKELQGVHPPLVAVVQRAINLTEQDFCVYDGIRTHKEQMAHVRAGTSKTMKSKHLEGLAVDLVPWVGGKPVWDWDRCYRIAHAMDRAATELGVADKIIWGGAWDRRLSDFGGDEKAYAAEVAKYRDRHAGSDFIDGPHFEWRD